jgi:hypothetical protein
MQFDAAAHAIGMRGEVLAADEVAEQRADPPVLIGGR